MIQSREAPLGRLWALEYAGWCVTHCIAVAGGLEAAYRLGRAHDAFERLGAQRDRTEPGKSAARRLR